MLIKPIGRWGTIMAQKISDPSNIIWRSPYVK